MTEMSQVQPVVMQPTGQLQTIVVTQQPGQTVVPVGQQLVPAQRMWNSGLFSCTDDMKICCCGLFLGPCLLCKTSGRLGEGCCFPTFCGPSALYGLRVKLRAQHNIQGTLCNDAFISMCCADCSSCQIARELDSLGYK